jgi:hypothetical protein
LFSFQRYRNYLYRDSNPEHLLSPGLWPLIQWSPLPVKQLWPWRTSYIVLNSHSYSKFLHQHSNSGHFSAIFTFLHSFAGLKK